MLCFINQTVGVEKEEVTELCQSSITRYYKGNLITIYHILTLHNVPVRYYYPILQVRKLRPSTGAEGEQGCELTSSDSHHYTI